MSSKKGHKRSRSGSPDRSKSPKKRKLSKSKSKEASSSSSEHKRRSRPAKQLIEPKVNGNKKSKIVSIYGIGNNELGQLGQELSEHKFEEPLLIGEFSDINCLDVACGSYFNVVIEANNIHKYRKVWQWGSMIFNRDTDTKKEVKSPNDELSHIPRPISVFDKEFIIQVCAGESHAAALNIDGKVYTWGIYKSNSKKDPNIGLRPNGGKNDVQEEPEIVQDIPDPVVQIACTSNRTICLTEIGAIFEWGNTKMVDKVLTRHAKSSLTPTILNVSEKIRAIYTGYGEHAFGVGEKNVYAWGTNVHYELGIDKLVVDEPKPEGEEKSGDSKSKDSKSKESKSKESKKKDDEKKKNEKGGKKGGKKDEDQEDKEKDKKNSDEEDNKDKEKKEEEEPKKKRPFRRKKKDYHNRPIKAKLLNEFGTEFVQDIKKIACGKHHSCLLTIEGELFVWGSNNYGQLGLGILDEVVPEPRKLEDYAVSDVACGAFHTAILTKDGKLHAFGWAKEGRFPSSNEKEISPVVISDHKKNKRTKIVAVYCGKKHILFAEESDN